MQDDTTTTPGQDAELLKLHARWRDLEADRLALELRVRSGDDAPTETETMTSATATIVTLYKAHSGFSNTPNAWVTNSAPCDLYKGDYAQDFALPAGYTLECTALGDYAIYHDATGKHCDIVEHESGWPQIVGPEAPLMPVLDVAGEPRGI